MKFFWPFYILWCGGWLAYNFSVDAPAWESCIQACFLGVAVTMLAVERRWLS